MLFFSYNLILKIVLLQMEFQRIGKKLQEEYSMHSLYKERDKPKKNNDIGLIIIFFWLDKVLYNDHINLLGGEILKFPTYSRD